jgi:hypothetical protein
VMVLMVMAIEKRGSMKCRQYNKLGSFCNSIFHKITSA